MKQVWKRAFEKCIPVIVSYIFVGIAYGIVAAQAGISWWNVGLASLFIYTGAFQFIMVPLVASGASLLTVGIAAFLLNSRQTFYALTFAKEFRAYKKARIFMIHSLTDETYALNCSLDDKEPQRLSVMFCSALICWMSWFAGSITGALAAELLKLPLEGLDFCLSALFVTIFIDQWEKAVSKIPALTGIVLGIFCLLVFGQFNFMLPALCLVSAALIFWNSRKDTAGKPAPVSKQELSMEEEYE